MAWPRKPVTIYDEDSGTYCIETILALITLLFLILGVGLHSSSNGLLICSSAGSLCGIVALIFSISAIRNASRNSRSNRMVIGIEGLILSGCFTFANAYMLLVDSLHILPSIGI